MNAINIVVIGLMALFLGFGAGYAASDGGWHRDCAAIGAHVTGGKVWECKERK